MNRRNWSKSDPAIQGVLISEIETALHCDWSTLDPDLKRLYLCLSGVLKPRAFETWLNKPYMYSPYSPTTPLDLIIEGQIEEVIEFASKYYGTSFT